MDDRLRESDLDPARRVLAFLPGALSTTSACTDLLLDEHGIAAATHGSAPINVRYTAMVADDATDSIKREATHFVTDKPLIDALRGIQRRSGSPWNLGKHLSDTCGRSRGQQPRDVG